MRNRPTPAHHVAACALALAVAATTLAACTGTETPSEPQAPSGTGSANEQEAAMTAENLMDGIVANGAATGDDAFAVPQLSEAQSVAVADFAVNLLKEVRADADAAENALVSPLSAQSALGMVANGAEGETLKQMEAVLGLPTADLNAALAALLRDASTDADDALDSGTDADGSPESATHGEARAPGEANTPSATDVANSSTEASALKLANSLWLRTDFSPSPTFLQANADFYRAGIFRAPFDRTTVNDINAWTNQHTDGMIPSIEDDLSPDAVMYLVNALAFDGAWANPYEDAQVRDDEFTVQDGTRTTTPFLFSTEGGYVEGAGATGFVKRYEGGAYAFVALLPDEGLAPDDVLDALDGAAWCDLVGQARHAIVDASIPQFSLDYEAELSQTLAALGMPDALDEARADFSGIATAVPNGGNLFIGNVTHKTHFELDQNGTRAAAATSIGLAATSAAPTEEPERKTVHLTRPFVYAVVDLATNSPIFLGVLDSVE